MLARQLCARWRRRGKARASSAMLIALLACEISVRPRRPSWPTPRPRSPAHRWADLRRSPAVLRAAAAAALQSEQAAALAARIIKPTLNSLPPFLPSANWRAALKALQRAERWMALKGSSLARLRVHATLSEVGSLGAPFSAVQNSIETYSSGY